MKVQSWNVVSCHIALIFFILSLNKFGILLALVIAFFIEFTVSGLKYLFFSLFMNIGILLDRPKFINFVIVFTSIMLFISKYWLLGVSLLVYNFLLKLIFQIPSVFIWDKLLGKPDPRIYAYFRLKKKNTGAIMPKRDEMVEIFMDEPDSLEKMSICIWMGI